MIRYIVTLGMTLVFMFGTTLSFAEQRGEMKIIDLTQQQSIPQDQELKNAESSEKIIKPKETGKPKDQQAQTDPTSEKEILTMPRHRLMMPIPKDPLLE